MDGINLGTSNPAAVIGQSLFGYSQRSDRAFVQGLLDEGRMGPYEIAVGKWTHKYNAMTVVQVGLPPNQKSFLFGYASFTSGAEPRFWFIQEVLPTGELAPDSDSNTFGHDWPYICGYSADGRGYIFGHRDDGSWFIQEITYDGKLGKETASGKFGNCYQTVRTVTVGNRNFVFLQRRSDGRWYLQELLPGGFLGAETDTGRFDSFYTSVCAAKVDEVNTFLIGQTNDIGRGNYYFVQRVTAAGKLAETTKSGKWDNFYPTLAALKTATGTFLFGQSDPLLANSRWFMAPVAANGLIGDETASGRWANYYSFVASVPTPRAVLMDRWMAAMGPAIAGQTFKRMIMPGSHDAGMYVIRDSTVFAGPGNTQTQTKTVFEQLMSGSRYFDLRPVLSQGKFRIGHYNDTSIHVGEVHDVALDIHLGLLGANGADLDAILNDVNAFLGDRSRRELVVLKFSHCMDLKTGKDFTDDDWRSLIATVKNHPVGQRLFRCPEIPAGQYAPLGSLTMRDYLKNGNTALAVFKCPPALRDPAAGIFQYADIPHDDKDASIPAGDLRVYDNYASMAIMEDMEQDQWKELTNANCHRGDMYLFSWTLTQNDVQAFLSSREALLIVGVALGLALPVSVAEIAAYIFTGKALNISEESWAKIEAEIRKAQTALGDLIGKLDVPPITDWLAEIIGRTSILDMADHVNPRLSAELAKWYVWWAAQTSRPEMLPNVVLMDQVDPIYTVPVVSTLAKTLPLPPSLA